MTGKNDERNKNTKTSPTLSRQRSQSMSHDNRERTSKGLRKKSYSSSSTSTRSEVGRSDDDSWTLSSSSEELNIKPSRQRSKSTNQIFMESKSSPRNPQNKASTQPEINPFRRERFRSLPTTIEPLTERQKLMRVIEYLRLWSNHQSNLRIEFSFLIQALVDISDLARRENEGDNGLLYLITNQYLSKAIGGATDFAKLIRDAQPRYRRVLFYIGVGLMALGSLAFLLATIATIVVNLNLFIMLPTTWYLGSAALATGLSCLFLGRNTQKVNILTNIQTNFTSVKDLININTNEEIPIINLTGL